MQISYAQNLEDTHLEAIFADQPTGTYVDVGGGHPVADNVSFWFYLKGWRGLIVEPQTALAGAYRHIRPRDLVFEGLAGATDGATSFFEVAGLHGLSSMDRDAAERARQYGAGFQTLEKPVRRLDALIAEAGLETIDFLKIDVEGAEDQVLAGLDLERVRPRLIVVEAVNPGNPDGRAGVWEERLLAARYSFVLFDNLNRFYVAEEAAAVLGPRIPKALGKWDDVGHLWDHGRALDNPDHADHQLARVLTHGLMALLPSLDPKLLERAVAQGFAALKIAPGSDAARAALTGTAEYPGLDQTHKELADLVRSDRFRAALGRIACFYDGGHIVE